MIEVFTGLLLVALIGGGFLIARRLFDRRNTMDPPMEMPWQQSYGPRDEYGRSFQPNPGYDGPAYGRPMYGPGYGNPGYGRPVYGPGYDPTAYGRAIHGPAVCGGIVTRSVDRSAISRVPITGTIHGPAVCGAIIAWVRLKTATVFISWAVGLLPWHFHWRIHRITPVEEAASYQEASSNERHQEQSCEHLYHNVCLLLNGKVTISNKHDSFVSSEPF